MKFKLGQPNIKHDSNINEVEIPQEMQNPVSTGHPVVDFLFAGDGVVRSTTAIVTGGPAAGKTSLLLQIADEITKSGNIALFNTGEESLFQVKKHVERMKLTNGFIASYNTSVDDIVKQMDLLRAESPEKILFLIQDSIQTLEPSEVPEFDKTTGKLKRRRKPTGAMAEFLAVKTLAEYAKENYIVVFFICQMTKDGKFAGLNKLKHLIDCHLHLGFDDNKERPTYNKRIAEMEKNRFGVAFKTFEFNLGESGVTFLISNNLKNLKDLPHELFANLINLAKKR